MLGHQPGLLGRGRLAGARPDDRAVGVDERGLREERGDGRPARLAGLLGRALAAAGVLGLGPLAGEVGLDALAGRRLRPAGVVAERVGLPRLEPERLRVLLDELADDLAALGGPDADALAERGHAAAVVRDVLGDGVAAAVEADGPVLVDLPGLDAAGHAEDAGVDLAGRVGPDRLEVGVLAGEVREDRVGALAALADGVLHQERVEVGEPDGGPGPELPGERELEAGPHLAEPVLDHPLGLLRLGPDGLDPERVERALVGLAPGERAAVGLEGPREVADRVGVGRPVPDVVEVLEPDGHALAGGRDDPGDPEPREAVDVARVPRPELEVVDLVGELLGPDHEEPVAAVGVVALELEVLAPGVVELGLLVGDARLDPGVGPALAHHQLLVEDPVDGRDGRDLVLGDALVEELPAEDVARDLALGRPERHALDLPAHDVLDEPSVVLLRLGAPLDGALPELAEVAVERVLGDAEPGGLGDDVGRPLGVRGLLPGPLDGLERVGVDLHAASELTWAGRSACWRSARTACIPVRSLPASRFVSEETSARLPTWRSTKSASWAASQPRRSW